MTVRCTDCKMPIRDEDFPGHECFPPDVKREKEAVAAREKAEAAAAKVEPKVDPALAESAERAEWAKTHSGPVKKPKTEPKTTDTGATTKAAVRS